MAPRSDEDLSPHFEMRAYWHDTFDQVFQDFHPDEWKLEPTKDAMPKEWRRFKDSAKVKFVCNECQNSWTSMKGLVIFWFKKIDTTDKRDGLTQQEEVDEETRVPSTGDKNVYSLRFKLYGQQCRSCSDEDFQLPKWYKEEVEKALNNVHRKIGELFYDFKKEEPDTSKRHGRPRWSHDSKRCQACQEGQCSQS